MLKQQGAAGSHREPLAVCGTVGKTGHPPFPASHPAAFLRCLGSHTSPISNFQWDISYQKLGRGKLRTTWQGFSAARLDFLEEKQVSDKGNCRLRF